MYRTWFLLALIPGLAASPSGHMPVRFEPSAEGGFVARAGSHAYYITPSGVLRLSPHTEMRFAGATDSARCSPLDRLPGETNDLRGSDHSRWRTHIPQYGRITCRHLYSGVDIVYRANESEIEYDFAVAPGASPDRIRLEFHGAGSVTLNPQGEVVVRAEGRDFRLHLPRITQGDNLIDGSYRLTGGNRVVFHAGPYDRARALLIDPVLGYASFFGTGLDNIRSVAVDPSGNVYIAGTTVSEIPLVNPLKSQ